MKKALLAAAGLVSLTLGGAASLYAAAELPKNNFNLGPGPVTEQEIRDKLAAAGFSDIRITTRNFFDAAANKNGRALQLAIDPQSGKAIRTGIDDDDDDD
jgi:hypothetical protein